MRRLATTRDDMPEYAAPRAGPYPDVRHPHDCS
jgi:hypothetical protein